MDEDQIPAADGDAVAMTVPVNPPASPAASEDVGASFAAPASEGDDDGDASSEHATTMLRPANTNEIAPPRMPHGSAVRRGCSLRAMAYDEELADRIRAALADRTDVVEKKMFGGIAFMVKGSMAC